jgi:hypothetical protein
MLIGPIRRKRQEKWLYLMITAHIGWRIRLGMAINQVSAGL